MVAKVLAVFLTAVVIVDAKALPGAQKHEKKSKPKSEVQSAPPPAAQPTANVQQPATKCALLCSNPLRLLSKLTFLCRQVREKIITVCVCAVQVRKKVIALFFYFANLRRPEEGL